MFSSDASLTNYQRLQQSLRLLEARACSINTRFVELSKHKEVCIAQTIVNYRISSAAIPMMEAVVSAAKLKLSDPVCPPLIDYILTHILEEQNHDEWCLDDLEVLGLKREQVIAQPPSTNIAALIGSQYYWINHIHPVAFMGYLACLETHHPTVEYVEQLIKNSGLPREGFNCLMHHAKVDIHHKQEIIDMINNLPMTEEQFKLVELSAFQTFRYVSLIMEEVCNSIK